MSGLLGGWTNPVGQIVQAAVFPGPLPDTIHGKSQAVGTPDFSVPVLPDPAAGQSAAQCVVTVPAQLVGYRNAVTSSPSVESGIGAWNGFRGVDVNPNRITTDAYVGSACAEMALVGGAAATTAHLSHASIVSSGTLSQFTPVVEGYTYGLHIASKVVAAAAQVSKVHLQWRLWDASGSYINNGDVAGVNGAVTNPTTGAWYPLYGTVAIPAGFGVVYISAVAVWDIPTAGDYTFRADAAMIIANPVDTLPAYVDVSAPLSSVGLSNASLALTAKTTVPLDAAASTSGDALAVTAPTFVSPDVAASTATVASLVTAQTQVVPQAAAASSVGSATVSITTPVIPATAAATSTSSNFVTVAQVLVGLQYRNEVTDPSVESSLGNWTAWNGAALLTPTLVTTDAFVGSRSAEVSQASLVSGTNLQIIAAKSGNGAGDNADTISVTPGQTVGLFMAGKAVAQPATPGTLTLGFRYYNANGSFRSLTTATVIASAVTGQWYSLYTTNVIPASVSFVTVEVLLNANATGAHTLRADAAMVVLSPPAGTLAYVDGSQAWGSWNGTADSSTSTYNGPLLATNVSGDSLKVTAPTKVIPDVAACTSGASLAITAPTQIISQAAVAASGVSALVTALTTVTPAVAAATSSSANSITAPSLITGVSVSTSIGAASVTARTFVTPATAASSSASALAATAPTFVSPAGAAGTSSSALTATAATQVSPQASNGLSASQNAVTARTFVSPDVAAGASASANLVTAATKVVPATAAAGSTGTASVTVGQVAVVPDVATASSTSTNNVTAPGLLSLTADCQAGDSLSVTAATQILLGASSSTSTTSNLVTTPTPVAPSSASGQSTSQASFTASTRVQPAAATSSCTTAGLVTIQATVLPATSACGSSGSVAISAPSAISGNATSESSSTIFVKVGQVVVIPDVANSSSTVAIHIDVASTLPGPGHWTAPLYGSLTRGSAGQINDTAAGHILRSSPGHSLPVPPGR